MHGVGSTLILFVGGPPGAAKPCRTLTYIPPDVETRSEMNEDVVVPLTPCERLGFFRRHLLADIIPFWPRYALDRHTGALRTCIADDGTIVSGDIYMWSQLRAIYTFSALYNRIERRKKWLEIGEKAGTLENREYALHDTGLEGMQDKAWFKGINWK